MILYDTLKSDLIIQFLCHSFYTIHYFTRSSARIPKVSNKSSLPWSANYAPIQYNQFYSTPYLAYFFDAIKVPEEMFFYANSRFSTSSHPISRRSKMFSWITLSFADFQRIRIRQLQISSIRNVKETGGSNNNGDLKNTKNAHISR